jgi:hypothetical protein
MFYSPENIQESFMTDIFSIKRDSSKVNEGIEITLVEPKGAKIRFRHIEYRPYTKYIEEQTAILTKQNRNKPLSNTQRMNLVIRGIVRHLLVDWNFTEQGKPIPFSVQAAEKLLLDPDYSDLAEQVVIAITESGDAFRVDADGIEKNSEPT